MAEKKAFQSKTKKQIFFKQKIPFDSKLDGNHLNCPRQARRSFLRHKCLFHLSLTQLLFGPFSVVYKVGNVFQYSLFTICMVNTSQVFFIKISSNIRMDTRIGNLTSKAFNVWCYRRKILSMCVYGVRRSWSTNAKVVEVAFT